MQNRNERVNRKRRKQIHNQTGRESPTILHTWRNNSHINKKIESSTKALIGRKRAGDVALFKVLQPKNDQDGQQTQV